MGTKYSKQYLTFCLKLRSAAERGNKRKSQLWAPLTWIAQQWKGWKKM